ncbi:MAG TPA: 3-phosphoshikimate 1-carboxyvinyltransferase [Polyangia bacterium]|nr:3-phosphoshikimate 1-carboxyvinyltransferase [Polyangia bacterium]
MSGGGALETLRVRGRSRALAGDVSVPGDKSIGHRSVLFAAIADGRATVRGLSGGEDNRSTIGVLRALGVAIRDVATGTVEVEGRGLDGLRAAAGDLDCGNSGTSIRLFAGLLASRPFASRLVGDQYLHARPMKRVVEPLAEMGARITGEAGKKPNEVYPPLAVAAATGRLHGIRYASRVASAQVKSAIVLAALAAEGVTTVVEPERSRDHTERMLAHMGAPLTVRGLEITVDPYGWDRRLAARDLTVPGDLSSAAFLLGAAAVVPGSRIVVRGVGVNPTRTGVVDALRAMGASIEVSDERLVGGEPVADLSCTGGALRGIRISGELAVRAIDELPLIAAVAAHAEGETRIADAAELRVKESDRVAATAAMLRALGVEVEEHPDGLTVRGGRGVGAGTVESHGDHRIAMAGAVCALGAEGETLIRDTKNVATSFPGFARALAALGAEIG